jgi:hypothetical protein
MLSYAPPRFHGIKKFQTKISEFFSVNIFLYFEIPHPIGVCLRKFGRSRTAGLAVKGIRTVVKGLAKLLYRFRVKQSDFVISMSSKGFKFSAFCFVFIIFVQIHTFLYDFLRTMAMAPATIVESRREIPYGNINL